MAINAGYQVRSKVDSDKIKVGEKFVFNVVDLSTTGSRQKTYVTMEVIVGSILTIEGEHYKVVRTMDGMSIYLKPFNVSQRY